jgi:hypothetical protein
VTGGTQFLELTSVFFFSAVLIGLRRAAGLIYWQNILGFRNFECIAPIHNRRRFHTETCLMLFRNGGRRWYNTVHH